MRLYLVMPESGDEGDSARLVPRIQRLEQAEQVINLIFVILAQEDTQATLVDQETHQRVHQVEAQDLLTLMIQEEEVKAVQVDQAYTD